jgi:hypothetical protein
MTALGHILHTNVLLQHDSINLCTAYQCVVGAWHISEALKDVLSGKSIEEDQDMFFKWLGMQSEDFFNEFLKLSELLEDWC